MKSSQSTSAVLMVRPTSFGFNEQTAITNTFQNHVSLSPEELHTRANQEFTAMVQKLQDNGVHVTVFEDTDALRKPDAVFPNNWFSAWPDGHVYLYPMATESRRVERSYMAIHALAKDFTITQVTDMSATENYGLFLESTGVMIFDHENKVVYGCISPRCDAGLFTDHAIKLGYKPVVFHAFGQDGTAVYHTNVLMGVQGATAVICAEAITDEQERTLVLETLKNTGHDVVEITQEQMSSFCGNVLELSNDVGERFLAMSQTAYDNFTDEQRARLSKDKTLLPCNVTTIETVGGGSVRCMLGEVFLPRKTDVKQLVGEVLQASSDTVVI